MRISTATSILLAACLLAACGSRDDDREDRVRDAGDSELAQPMLEAIDKAKAVEEQGLERKDEMDRALEEAEGAGEPPSETP